MKIIILLCYAVAVCVAVRARKPTKDPFIDFIGEPGLNLITDEDDKPPSTFTGNVMHAKITNLKNSNHGSGKFNFNFETQNGINIAQIGKLRDDKTFVVSGSYSYTGADGKRYRVKYTADEFGYHPITELDDSDLPTIVLPVKPSKRLQPSGSLPSLDARFGSGRGGDGQNNINLGSRQGRTGINPISSDGPDGRLGYRQLPQLNSGLVRGNAVNNAANSGLGLGLNNGLNGGNIAKFGVYSLVDARNDSPQGVKGISETLRNDNGLKKDVNVYSARNDDIVNKLGVKKPNPTNNVNGRLYLPPNGQRPTSDSTGETYLNVFVPPSIPGRSVPAVTQDTKYLPSQGKASLNSALRITTHSQQANAQKTSISTTSGKQYLPPHTTRATTKLPAANPSQSTTLLTQKSGALFQPVQQSTQTRPKEYLPPKSSRGTLRPPTARTTGPLTRLSTPGKEYLPAQKKAATAATSTRRPISPSLAPHLTSIPLKLQTAVPSNRQTVIQSTKAPSTQSPSRLTPTVRLSTPGKEYLPAQTRSNVIRTTTQTSETSALLITSTLRPPTTILSIRQQKASTPGETYLPPRLLKLTTVATRAPTTTAEPDRDLDLSLQNNDLILLLPSKTIQSRNYLPPSTP